MRRPGAAHSFVCKHHKREIQLGSSTVTSGTWDDRSSSAIIAQSKGEQRSHRHGWMVLDMSSTAFWANCTTHVESSTGSVVYRRYDSTERKRGTVGVKVWMIAIWFQIPLFGRAKKNTYSLDSRLNNRPPVLTQSPWRVYTKGGQLFKQEDFCLNESHLYEHRYFRWNLRSTFNRFYSRVAECYTSELSLTEKPDFLYCQFGLRWTTRHEALSSSGWFSQLSDQFIEGVQPALRAQLRLARATGQLSVEHLARELAEAPLATLQSQQNREDSTVEDLKNNVDQLVEQLAAHQDGIAETIVQIVIETDGKRELWLIDTGAGVSLRRRGNQAERRPCALAMRAVGGYRLKIDGLSMHSIRLGDKSVQHTFLISPDIERTTLGADFLKNADFVVDLKRRKLVTNVGQSSLKHRSTETATFIVWLIEVDKYAGSYNNQTKPSSFVTGEIKNCRTRCN
ncbi:gap-Pol polyprotein [Clonorchis sinensis]|uniref:Gap-Pol polyprotein n=1 Tax=Clonorchis sinensis TaxID=79923 RepID=G7Y5X3_CLOSI|nr:gap-Pol polyprotein [Clonorchis sinensis]